MTARWLADDAPLRLGISACLLGREVRHDGGHKRDRFLTDVLGAYVEWVPVCPEVEIGMSIPRPSITISAPCGVSITARRRYWWRVRIAASAAARFFMAANPAA